MYVLLRGLFRRKLTKWWPLCCHMTSYGHLDIQASSCREIVSGWKVSPKYDIVWNKNCRLQTYFVTKPSGDFPAEEQLIVWHNDDTVTVTDLVNTIVLRRHRTRWIFNKALHWLRINERIKYKLLSVTYKVLTTSISPQPDFCSTLSRHTFFFYSHSYSSTKSVLFENHQSLFSVRCTLSLEWTSHRTTLASSHTVFPTFTFCCTWQFITTTFSTITTICHYFSLSFRT